MTPRERRRLDAASRTLLLALLALGMFGCAPSCVVYQHQAQTTCPPPAAPATTTPATK